MFVLSWFIWLYLFFFFKQKTAYEMRIIVWSSDVCSSDLLIIGYDKSGAPMCSDKSVVTRSRSVGKWNDPLIAFGLFAIGVLLYLVGLYQMWTDVGGVADVPVGVRIGMLALLCAIDSFRRVRPATALAAGAVIVAVDAALGPTLPMWLEIGRAHV